MQPNTQIIKSSEFGGNYSIIQTTQQKKSVPELPIIPQEFRKYSLKEMSLNPKEPDNKSDTSSVLRRIREIQKKSRDLQQQNASPDGEFKAPAPKSFNKSSENKSSEISGNQHQKHLTKMNQQIQKAQSNTFIRRKSISMNNLTTDVSTLQHLRQLNKQYQKETNGIDDESINQYKNFNPSKQRNDPQIKRVTIQDAKMSKGDTSIYHISDVDSVSQGIDSESEASNFLNQKKEDQFYQFQKEGA